MRLRLRKAIRSRPDPAETGAAAPGLSRFKGPMLNVAFVALRHNIKNEGQALLVLDKAREKLNLSDRTVGFLRQAVVSHFDSVADTVRSPAPAEAFAASEGDFTVAPVDGVQAPPTPRTVLPPSPTVSDMGFELDPA